MNECLDELSRNMGKGYVRTGMRRTPSDSVNSLVTCSKGFLRECTITPLRRSRNGSLVLFSKVGREPDDVIWQLTSAADMIISVKENTVFSVFHPDAHDLFNTCSDLKKVVWELWDPQRRLDEQVC